MGFTNVGTIFVLVIQFMSPYMRTLHFVRASGLDLYYHRILGGFIY